MSRKYDFVRVTGREFSVLCCSCEDRQRVGHHRVWADLNGAPFVAYYCDFCRRRIEDSDRRTGTA